MGIAGTTAMSNRTSPFSMRLPPDMKAKLQKMADRDRRSLTNYIEVVLQQHIEREEGAARP
jgi:predicted transcriptional regulator